MAEYEGVVRELLEGAGAKPGDEVEVRAGEGRTLRGLVMQHHQFSSADVLTLKLSSGYNVGVRVDGDTTLHKLGEGPTKSPVSEARPSGAQEKPRVSILGTGGTIASYVDYRTGAVWPVTKPDQLALAVPELFEKADVRTRIVFSLFSEDLQPEHWRELARAVKEEFDGGARGVVVTHGTDTLGYTAAALAFFLKDLPGPVVLVGAQRSSDRPSSDAAINLLAATTVAAETDLGEVVAVMHAGTGDGVCDIHRGVRVRKMHTSRRDAFQSINARPLGRVEIDLKGGSTKVALTEDYRRATGGPVQVDDVLEEEVSMIQSYPGLWPDHLEKVVLKGVVLVGTGLGHVAHRNLEMIRTISTGRHPDGSPRLRYDGGEAGPAFVVMTSQSLHGRVNMNVYSSGRDLQNAGAISGEDMLPEVAYIKLMWVLGHTTDREEVERLMRTSLVGEIDPRTPIDAYPGDGALVPDEASKPA